MRDRMFSLFALSLAISFLTPWSMLRPACAASDFERTLQSILPTKDEEVWMQIPWRTNVTDARLDAQNQHKPLFLWVMNGHPLGCT
jgi:hypothetical protein